MGRKLFLIIFIALIIKETTISQQISPQPVTPGQLIKSWFLCGPFPIKEPKDASLSWDHLVGFNTDYLTKSGGEQNPRVKAGDVVRYAKGSAIWKLYNSPDLIIDLDKAVSEDEPVLAYAYTEIQSDETKVMFIGLGTNDGGKLWLNGVNIWDNPQACGLVSDDDMIPVLVKKGKNTLLLKVEERGNSWGFCVRFLPFSKTDLEVRGELFTIKTGEDGEVIIDSKFTTPVLHQLINNLDIEIFNSQKLPVLKEQRITGFCGKIDIRSKDYQSYTALLDIRFKNGENIPRKFSYFAGRRMIYTLFSDKKSDYRIALSSGASESEQWAAKELQHWIKETGGVELPIQNTDQPNKGSQVVIGNNDFIKEKTGANAPSDLDESYCYRNSGPNI